MGVTALVLSGGGIRGAYQAGVLAGMLEVLGPCERPPFDLFVGTSAGALNATWLAAHAHLPDLGVPALVAVWESLDPRHMLRLGRVAARGRSLLDPAPLERLAREGVDWSLLRRHIDEGRISGLIVPALDIHDGRTHLFADLTPGATYQPSRDPRRRLVRAPITAQMVLASAAIPVLYPPREVDGRVYVDGGLRFNTPLSPAIRAGADRLVVLPTLGTEAPRPQPDGWPGLLFLAGKVLNALLLDPIDYDLQVLERINRVVRALDAELDADERARVDDVLEDARGAGYRWLDTLVVRPTADIGRLTLEHLQAHGRDLDVSPPIRWLLRRAAAGPRPTQEADWATFVLFDGGLARRLVALGRADALAKAGAVRAFFEAPDRPRRVGGRVVAADPAP